MQYSASARGTGHWERLDDPIAWMWTAVAAFFVGFWGYGAILISALSPKQLGRVMFIVLGFMYLGAAAYFGSDAFSAGTGFSMFVDALIIPVGASIIMLPMFLLVSIIGRVAG